MHTEPLVLIACIILAGTALLLLQRRRGPIRVDAHGVSVARSPSSPLFLAWEEVDGFGVATVSEIEGGLHQTGGTQYVGVRLKDSSEKKRTRACANNRLLSDYDILLTPDPGTPVDRFATYLESQKQSSNQANQAPEPTTTAARDRLV